VTTTNRTITLGLAAGALFLVSLFIVPSASAQVTGDCAVAIQGRNVNDISDWTDAVLVDAEGTLIVEGLSTAPVSFVKVELDFGGIRREIPPGQPPRRGQDWNAVLPVRDYADEGVGLYHVIASTDACTAAGWIKVVGRSPFTTVAGLVATGVLALGLVLQVIGLIGAGRRKGRALAIVGGIPTGLGALVLSQQFGVIPITWGWASAWAVGPGALGGVAHAAVGALRRPPALPERSAVEPPSAGVEPPTAEAEPPMTEAEPPVAEAPPPPPTAEAPAPTRAEPRFRGMEPVTRGAEIPHGATFPTGATRGMRPPAERDPPRSAYALLDCPGVVVAEEEFELSAGISEKPTPGVTGGQITRPPTSVGPYVLSVQVVADGFRLAEGAGSWRRDLQVSADAPYPTFVLRLAAEPQIERIKPRAIQAMYSVDGQTIGMAVRSVAVVRSQDLVGRAEEVPQEGGVDIAIPSGETAPDLTVRIVHSRTEGGGRLLWTFESPHRLPSSDAPVVADIGLQPEAFAKRLVEQIAAHEGQPGLYQYLMGIGNTVSDQVPEEFWEVLRAIAEQIGGRSPSLLVLSEEPYVPWELAVMDPPLDPSLPPFLSAQVSVGRWVLGQRRPKLPPPTDVQVDALAVVWGVYDRQEWRLVEAEAEAASLTDKFGALSVDAQAALVIECLKGNPKAELLHFAVHGIYNPTGPKEGLILVDGQTLDPLEVRGVKFQTAPFVFLNACQVGTGTAVLGDYAGMAEAFLYAGAAGVIAPLWSIDDALAREIALRFYQETLVEGRPPAEVFREERARFVDSPDLVSSTFLAYQFFGNPAMKLSRAGAPG